MESKIIKQVQIPPSTNLIKVLSSSGYTIESALADIVDNSIAHNANEIHVIFHRDGSNSTVEIIDDGEGMNYEVLKDAMSFAHHDIDQERDKNDLGRYGVGMKTASSSFCKTLRVESKGTDGEVNAFEFPFETKDWVIYQVEVSQDSIDSETGTKVIWKDLRLVNDPAENEKILTTDVESFSNICDRVAIHLSKAFGIYIKKGVRIFVNGDELDPWIPFEIPNGDVATVYEDSSFKIGSEKVTIKAFLLPIWDHMSEGQQDYATCHGNGRLMDYEGFYVYRHDRLIVCGGWLDIPGLSSGEKFNYARVVIWYEPTAEADSYFRVNFIKNSINVPEEFAVQLIKVAKIARSKSSNSYDFKKVKRPYQRHDKTQDVHVWNVQRKEHASYFSINENHPLVRRYTEGLHEAKKKALFDLLVREFPIQELSTGVTAKPDYTDEELYSMLCDSYEIKRKQQGMTFHDASRAILNESPFCDDKYRNKAKAFLAEILTKEEEGDV